MVRQSYRSREQSIGLGAFGVVVSSLGLVMGLAVIGSPGGGVAGVVMMVSAGLAFLLTYRAVRAGISVDACGVVIMNVTRRIEVPWTNLERFSIGTHGIWSRVGIAHLRDGSTVMIWGIQGPNPVARPKNRSAERLIETLNSRLLESA